jgi:hypothetical protein
MIAWVKPAYHIRETVGPKADGPMYKVGEVPLDLIHKAVKQLNEHPEVWDRYTMRTRMFENSPHRDVHDIWLRYRDFAEFDPDNPQAFAGPHQSLWYAAYYQLTAVRELVQYILREYAAESEIGGVLITKIKSGDSVLRHDDSKHWHSEHYFLKVMVHLQSAPGQRFSYDERSYGAKSGDVVFFNNLIPHSVVNESSTDRISLILAVRPKGFESWEQFAGDRG